MRIAVIGSGIAGLTAAWMLSQRHHVTLFERRPRVGMTADAHLLDGGPVVDLPLRVFHTGYYQRLLQLYAALGVETERVDYASSFTHVTGQPYFRYRNLRVDRHAIPYASPRELLRPDSLRIGLDALRFLLLAPRSPFPPARDLNLEDYLRRARYSAPFIERFLLPAMAGIATCTYDAVRAYPAHLVIDYFARALNFQGVRRVRAGADEVVSRLTAPVQAIHTHTPIHALFRHDDAVTLVTDPGGDPASARFDHVVLATQAHQAAAILDAEATPEERRALTHFTCERSRTILHRDPRLAPARREHWSPVNFIISDSHRAPMATIWMNAVQPELAHAPDLFQTWNPLREPRPDTLLADATFLRPVVTLDSEAALAALDSLHSAPHRRVWFAGSWAAPGVPLLESAVQSAVRVCRALGVDAPWAS